MIFVFKTNTNLQLGLGLKKVIKFDFFTKNLIDSIFITYKTDYMSKNQPLKFTRKSECIFITMKLKNNVKLNFQNVSLLIK